MKDKIKDINNNTKLQTWWYNYYWIINYCARMSKHPGGFINNVKGKSMCLCLVYVTIRVNLESSFIFINTIRVKFGVCVLFKRQLE